VPLNRQQRRFLRRKKKFAWLPASFLIGVLCSASPPARSQVMEPLLVGSSLAQVALSLGAPAPSAQMDAIVAVLNDLGAMNKRLDAIDSELKTMSNLLDYMPTQVNQELAEDRDVTGANNVLGDITVINLALSHLCTKDKCPRLSNDDRQALLNLVESRFLPDAEELPHLSDFAAPAMLASMIVYSEVAHAFPDSLYDTSAVVKQFDARLAEAQDPARPGSVASMLKELEVKQRGGEQDLAKAITGKKGALQDDSYPWFADTLVGTRKVEKVETIDRHIGLMPDASGRIVHYTVDVPYDVHTRYWRRQITKTCVAGQQGADLFTVKLQTVRPSQDVPGGAPGSERHTNSDHDFEQGKLKDLAYLQAKIDVFNARARAIGDLRNLAALIAGARVWAATQNCSLASALKAVAESEPVMARLELDELQQRERNAQLVAPTQQMLLAGQQSWDTIKRGQERVEADIKMAEAQNWRSDIIVGLQIFRLSVGLEQMAKAEFESERAAQLTRPSGKATMPTNRQQASTPSSIPPRVPVSIRVTPIPNAPDYSKNPLGAVAYVDKVIDDVKQHPASAWVQLPNHPVLEEMELLQAMTVLNQMKPTEADTMANEKGVTIGGVSQGLLDNLFAGQLPSKVAAVESLIKPQMTGDGTILGEGSRNLMRQQVNELYRQFVKKRLSQHP
jgi:hypothetical protein